MATGDHIRNPIEWGMDEVKAVSSALGRAGHDLRHPAEGGLSPVLTVRRIEIADLKDVLVKGFGDLGAYRTDILFIFIVYPLAGLILSRLAFGYELLPLVFPLMSGFALIGPVAAVGLYEISRQREAGHEISWATAFSVVGSHNFSAIVALGLLLFLIFVLWLIAANVIYLVTLGPEPPASISAFLSDIFTTGAGWAMIFLGVGVGFAFAALVLTISVISFPLLLDRNVGVTTAIATSVRAVTTNPRPMAVWGLIVAGGLVLGSLPALLGLILVIPVLGHATWHLYRKVVAQ